MLLNKFAKKSFTALLFPGDAAEDVEGLLLLLPVLDGVAVQDDDVVDANEEDEAVLLCSGS